MIRFFSPNNLAWNPTNQKKGNLQPAAVSNPPKWRGLGAVYDATAVEEFFRAKPFAVLGRWPGEVVLGGTVLY